MKAEKILLLGGSAQQVTAIREARNMGYETVLCDYLPDNPGQFAADHYYNISTTDRDAVLDIARKEQIDGILAYASDPAAPTAAWVAEQMHLPGNPFHSVETLCSKHLFRQFLKSHGFSCPESSSYQDLDDALKDASDFPYPVLVKPSDSSGSKGVTLLKSSEGLQSAAETAFSYSRAHEIIIEEYVSKSTPYLIGGDLFVVNGKVALWGLMNCYRDERINPLVPMGKSYPPFLSDGQLRLVKDTLSRMVSELQIQNGAMNVELILDQKDRVFVLDAGPRNGGNMIPELMGMIFDQDIVRMTIEAAMGKSVSVKETAGHPFYATHNLHSARRGKYLGIRFSEELNPYLIRKELWKKPGDQVVPFLNSAGALGIIFLKFPDRDTMEYYLRRMTDFYTVILDEDTSHE
ncbi:ATP-grasp domain-containing protein [Anaerolactibacter massiliensis]|uniref:ATP-binding protein n=1 Tax=Anaerolactibacter massiliensis TaxID=2044573 RepID=UPI000CF993EE|nr:ATP-grasp domain-containing protein [Anaerolactibacter massiliensis]